MEKNGSKGKLPISLEESENHFEIFPNPANSNITIRTNSSSKGVVKIINEIGVNVYTTILQGNNFKIDLSDLPKSIYFIEFKDENTGKSYKRKLVLY